MANDSYDWRLDELRRLGNRERQLATEMLEARDAVARLVKQLLPHHAPESWINTVVQASGYSRTLIEAIRGGRDAWTRR
ncbi:MAG TPA: hypothetical protein VFX61_01540 [Micromonosporaceae bacterium]|nr:hypothetical protein [Micromonosporaceae bacterium]